MKNSILSFLVTSIILIGHNTASYSQTAVAPAFGVGSAIDTYQIATWQNLYWISQNAASWDKYFIQTNDFELSATTPAITTWDGGKMVRKES